MSETTVKKVTGTTGLETQLPGEAATVSGAAEATGGIAPGNFIESDIDDELFRFNTDDTPLMNLMLRAKRVKVNSPEVDHYMIDEARSQVTVTHNVEGNGQMQAVLPLRASDQTIPRPYSTLLVKGVNGYDEQGREETPGKELMLFVTGYDPTSNNPVVRAVNGPRANTTDEVCTVPSIPKDTVCVVLANSLYETQKEVDPELIVPQPTKIYLQKRGMNQVVSDYFDSQRKRLPFSKAIIAEQAITNFKVRGNRTLWGGRAGKFKVNVPRMGMQYVYCTRRPALAVQTRTAASGQMDSGTCHSARKDVLYGGRCAEDRIVAGRQESSRADTMHRFLETSRDPDHHKNELHRVERH